LGHSVVVIMGRNYDTNLYFGKLNDISEHDHNTVYCSLHETDLSIAFDCPFFSLSLCLSLSLCGLNRSPSWPVWVPQLLQIPSPTTHRAVPTSTTSPIIDGSWSRFWSYRSPVTSQSKQNNKGNSSSKSLVSPSIADGLLKLPPSPAFLANHSSVRSSQSPNTPPAGVLSHFPPWASPTPRASSSPGMLHQHSPSSPRGSPADTLHGNNHTQR